MCNSDNIRASVSYTRIQTLHMIHRVCHYTFVRSHRSYIGNAPHIVDTCVLVMNHTKAGYSECIIQAIALHSALLPNQIFLHKTQTSLQKTSFWECIASIALIKAPMKACFFACLLFVGTCVFYQKH